MTSRVPGSPEAPRYALYYAPRPDEGIARAAGRWLGRDAETGQLFGQPIIPGVSSEQVAKATASPRRYGFHGTLKAPMALREDVSEGTFLSAVGDFAASTGSFAVPRLALVLLDGFLALVPAAACTELHALADRCVTEFDALRLPASDEELTRRRSGGLSPRQEALLARWGYPHVLDEWRFHLTLTGRIDDDATSVALAATLRLHFEAFIGRPLPVRDVCVFRESAPGQPFVVLSRFRLGGRSTVA